MSLGWKSITMTLIAGLVLFWLALGGASAAEEKQAPLVQNGWIVWRGEAIWGWTQHNGWWRAGQRANITRRSVGDPEGDVRPNRTEDLDLLTDNMLKYGYPGFEHNFGLWYDRRRDAHDETPRTTPDCQPPFLEQPWARSGEGQAADGQSKYDLTKWNDWYFDRVKQFADLCDEKGTVLFYKLYMQHALLEIQPHYVDFPWRPANCIQATGMPDRMPAANTFYDVSDSERARLHRLYIRKCLDTLGDNRNVVFLPSEEFTGPLAFVEFYVDTVLEWEAEKGKQVTLGLGAPKDVQDALLADPVRGPAIELLDLRYWWVRADGSLSAIEGGREVPGRDFESGSGQTKETTTERFYQKLRGYRDQYPDKALVDALNATRQDCWAFLMAGGSLLVRGQIEYPESIDPPAYIKPANMDIVLPTYDFIRQHLATKLPKMHPADLVKTAPELNWALADGGTTYLVYLLHGGSVTLDLSSAKGPLRARWFDPRTGQLGDGFSVQPSPDALLIAPDEQDWACLIETN